MLSREGVKFVLCQDRQVVGSGATAVVSVVRWRAHKAILKQMKVGTDASFYNEITFLKHLCGRGGAPELIGISYKPPLLVLSYRGHRTLLDALRDLHLPDSLVLWLGLEVARCLRQVHAVGVVHNDIKIDNVTVIIPRHKTQPPQVSIIDYGLACHTGVSLGLKMTHEADRYFWTAPEVLGGGVSSPHSDIFSLGVLLQDMMLFVRNHQYKTLLARVARRARQQDAACRPSLAELVDELTQGLLTLTSTPLLVSPSRPSRPSPPVLPQYCYTQYDQSASPNTTLLTRRCRRLGQALRTAFYSLAAKLCCCCVRDTHSLTD